MQQGMSCDYCLYSLCQRLHLLLAKLATMATALFLLLDIKSWVIRVQGQRMSLQDAAVQPK